MKECKPVPVFYKGGPRDGEEVPCSADRRYSIKPVPVFEDLLQVGEYRLKSVDGDLVSVWHEGEGS